MGSRVAFGFLLTAVVMGVSTVGAAHSGNMADDAAASSLSSSLSDVLAQASAQSAQANAQSAQYAAQAAAASAQIALIQAQSSAEQAKFGSVTGTSYSNDVSAAAVSSTGESGLMVAKAVNDASTKLAAAIGSTIRQCTGTDCRKDVVVVTDDATLNNSDLMRYEVTLARIDTAQKAAIAIFNLNQKCVFTPTPTAPGRKEEHAFGASLPAVSAAGLVIDTVAKFGSYLSSSYGYAAISVDSSQVDYLSAVSGALLTDKSLNSTPEKVIIPDGIYPEDMSAFTASLTPYETKYLELAGDDAICKGAVAMLKDSKDPKAADASNRFTMVSNSITAANTPYESLVQWLINSTDKVPTPPLVTVVQQQKIRPLLSTSYVLKLSAHPVSALYTKKNLWSFFGGPQLYTMGGVSLGYRLFDPSSGAILASGVIAQDSGYRSVSQVEKLFK